MRPTFRALGVVLMAFAISACSHLPDVRGAGETDAPADASPRTRLRSAIELLGQGEERRARSEIRAVLREQPNNAMAQSLIEQMEVDPQTLLGANARPYTVRQGETMSEIAERYLGNGLLFYALARYNNIEAPNQVSAGQVLMVPRRPGVAPQTMASRESAPVEAAIPSSPPPRTAEASRANQLRLQALQRLNTGQVDSAVSLLRQAQALDAANPAIQRDLDRAVRLQASLRLRAG